MIKRYFRKFIYREVVLEGSGCTSHLLKNRITSRAMLHREAGPAVIRANGDQYWYLNGYKYPFEEYVDRIFPEDSSAKTLFILKWSES